jgi:hypothetical protein
MEVPYRTLHEFAYIPTYLGVAQEAQGPLVLDPLVIFGSKGFRAEDHI